MLKKKDDVKSMFDAISKRYDFLNHFLSFGIDYWWRKKLISLLSVKQPQNILDVATGTGDLAIALAKLNPRKITGIDIAEKMLTIAREKIVQKKLNTIISFQTGDAENIPFSDNFFDAVTVAFGVRNYENLLQGLKEMNRVLKQGGTMMILEFSRPRSFFLSYLYRVYSRRIIPFTGKLISKHNHAYQYLPESVAAFPAGKDFLEILKEAGLKNNRQYPLTGGIATIYMGDK